MYEAKEFMRKGHSVWIDHDPRWLIDRERFRRQYEAMQREGLDRGYLDDDVCTVTTDVGWHDIEWDETWEEYGKRVAEITGKMELKYRDELLRDT